MNTRRTYFRSILTMSALLLAGCSSSGKSPDNVSPVITLTGDNPQVMAVGEAYVELGATASDNRDGDLTASIVINASAIDGSVPGTYQVSYNVSDAAGNTATTVTRTVIYEDRTAPIISLVGDDPLVLPIGSVYTDPGATASDNVDGDLSVSVTVDASAVDMMTPGDYEVTYTVIDAAGNVATTMTRTVTVQLTVPAEPTMSVTGDIKTLNFSWSEPDYVDYYRLLENADGHSGFTQLGDDIPAGTLTASHDIAVHLFDWVNAQYIVEACNAMGCSSSDVVIATDVMLDTIGYFKASNTDARDLFGVSVALSADGKTLAVGASDEYSNATGIDGNQDDNSASRAGAVYVFRNDGSAWHQEAYIKASNARPEYQFGRTVALSADGNTLAVGAIGSDRDQNDYIFSGETYVYRFDGANWSHEASFIGASSWEYQEPYFGSSVSLSADGNTLAVGEPYYNYNYWTIGMTHVYRYDGNQWGRQARLTRPRDEQFSGSRFGYSTALSADGNLLAVGSPGDRSEATGIDGDQYDVPNNESAYRSGAVILYRFEGAAWEQEAYVKASNTGREDRFGRSVSLSADGDVLAVGARLEDSAAMGINGVQNDESRTDAGAAYVFRSSGGIWSQEAYIKVADTCFGEICDDPTSLLSFGQSVVLTANGESLAVAGYVDDIEDSGTVSLFKFDGNDWTQQAYIKASNRDWSAYERPIAPRPPPVFCEGECNPLTDIGLDFLNWSVAISGDGETLALGAMLEASAAKGIGGDQSDESAEGAGAVYVY